MRQIFLREIELARARERESKRANERTLQTLPLQCRSHSDPFCVHTYEVKTTWKCTLLLKMKQKRYIHRKQ